MLALVASGTALAAAGDLDPTFGVDGKVTSHFGRDTQTIRDVVVDPEGRIVAAGAFHEGFGIGVFALARYEEDGSLDDSFGEGGRVTTAFGSSRVVANDVAMGLNGKIVVAGNDNDDFAVARY